MPLDQYYEKVADDESADPLVGRAKESRTIRAPPTEPRKRSALTILAILALVTTIFLAAVAAASSAVVAYRLPIATEAALRAKIEKEGYTKTPTVPSTTPTESNTNVEDTPDEDLDSLPAGGPEFLRGHHQPMRSCGGTPDEARAAGCVYDVMMQDWTPPECMDTALSERFLAKGNWTWYANSDASAVYTDEEIRLGNHDVVYVAQSYHRHHCIYSWERLVRALRTQSPIIEELISYDHVMHCRHTTLTLPSEGAAQDIRGVVAPTGYTKCASYDVWIGGNLPINKMSSVDKLKREIEAWVMPEEFAEMDI